MSHVCDWREPRWHTNPPLVFSKSLKLGDQRVVPGDPVTEEIREKLGPHRLKVWWRAGVLGTPLPGLSKSSSRKVADLGGGWYSVNGSRVRGKKAVQQLIG